VPAGGHVGLVGAEHAHELADDGVSAQVAHGRDRRLAAAVLRNAEVAVGVGGDLRQVGDAEHLALGRERVQLRADTKRLSSQLSSASANARIESEARTKLGLVRADPELTFHVQLAPPQR
jgi:cell division protein FtsL